MSTIKVDTIQDTSGNEQFTAKAWVNFNGTGTVAIRADGNVSSLTDNGTGDYTLNFTTATTDGNYSVVGVTGEVVEGNRSSGWCIRGNSTSYMTTSSVRLDVGSQSTGGAADTAVITVALFR